MITPRRLLRRPATRLRYWTLLARTVMVYALLKVGGRLKM